MRFVIVYKPHFIGLCGKSITETQIVI